MGSGSMALSEGLLLCQALLETSTPVPILRYIDSQNADGSYTYGFEGADGTYKIETRLANGQVRGKYGYYDPEGVLREATYGATKEGGFEPQIDGVILPPKQPAPLDPRRNEVIVRIAINIIFVIFHSNIIKILPIHQGGTCGTTTANCSSKVQQL